MKKICCSCRKAIEESNMVICGVCGATYHRSCFDSVSECKVCGDNRKSALRISEYKDDKDIENRIKKNDEIIKVLTGVLVIISAILAFILIMVLR